MDRHLLEAQFDAEVTEMRVVTEVCSLISGLSAGRIYLVGGAVYRTLAKIMHGISGPLPDLDFVIAGAVAMVPAGWNVAINHFGNQKWTKNGVEVDIIPLGSITRFKNRHIEPTIENYLKTVPLTIQSIAWDFESKKFLGEVGIQAVSSKTIRVHDALSAKENEERYKRSIKDLIEEKMRLFR